MSIVLLDLDDTLINYSGGADASWESTCAAASAAAGVAAETLVTSLFESRRWFWADPVRQVRERVNMINAWQQIAARALAECGCRTAALAQTMAEDYAERRRRAMTLFPDALVALEHFRAIGATLGLVTNGDARQQRDKIERHGLGHFFDVIVIEGEFGVGKPEAVVYHHALQALGATAADAVMIGDHLEYDVHGSQQVGIRGIWLDRPGVGLPADSTIRPHRIIRGLVELHVDGQT